MFARAQLDSRQVSQLAVDAVTSVDEAPAVVRVTMTTLEAVLVTVTQTSHHILFVPDAVTTTGMGDVTEVTRLEMIHRVVRGLSLIHI